MLVTAVDVGAQAVTSGPHPSSSSSTSDEEVVPRAQAEVSSDVAGRAFFCDDASHIPANFVPLESAPAVTSRVVSPAPLAAHEPTERKALDIPSSVEFIVADQPSVMDTEKAARTVSPSAPQSRPSQRPHPLATNARRPALASTAAVQVEGSERPPTSLDASPLQPLSCPPAGRTSWPATLAAAHSAADSAGRIVWCRSMDKRDRSPSGEAVAEINADEIVTTALKQWLALPAKCRPPPGESTVWAAVVIGWSGSTGAGRAVNCVAIGAGTRVVGYDPDDAESAAVAVFDGHAEALARRAFLRALLDDALHVLQSHTTPEEDTTLCGRFVQWCRRSLRWNLREGASIYFVVSAVPCGDATIPAAAAEPATNSSAGDAVVQPTYGGRVVQVPPAAGGDGETASACQTPSHMDDVLGHWVSRHRNGVDDVVPAVTRVKPGRGVPSLIMSCSDKLSRWAALGLQGAVGGLVLGNLPMAGVIIASDHCCAAALQRALHRSESACSAIVPAPHVCQAVAASVRCAESTPCGESVASCMTGAAAAWRCTAPSTLPEQINSKNGLRLGLTQKALRRQHHAPGARGAVHAAPVEGELAISRRAIAREVMRLEWWSAPGSERTPTVSYTELKARNAKYAQQRCCFLRPGGPFEHWVRKQRADFVLSAP